MARLAPEKTELRLSCHITIHLRHLLRDDTMPAKLTTQEFINRARAVHGDKYGYAFSVYQSAHKKVLISCNEHGIFEQSPSNHIGGRGCPECKFEKIGKQKRSNTDSFVTKAKLVHGNKYDYTSVNYVTNTSKVTITCRIHGNFKQTPSDHINGCGCNICRYDSVSEKLSFTKEQFIEKSISVHGDDYDYSKSNYINANTKVSIICKKHGSFTQIPSSHLSGCGCPNCAEYGFDREGTGYLYLLRSKCGQYCKIGITNKPSKRHLQLRRSTPFQFDVIECVKGPGSVVAYSEKILLSSSEPITFTDTFDGHTEWRLWDESIRTRMLSLMD